MEETVMQEKYFGQDNAFRWVIIHTDKVKLTADTLADDTIDNDIIAYAMDENERAIVNYDADDQALLVIYNALDHYRTSEHYETIPVTFIVQPDRLITIVNDKSEYLIAHFNQYLMHHRQVSVNKFFFSCLTLITERYFPVMDAIDKEKDILNRKLRQRTNKHNLFALSDLETGSVYLQVAANQNVLLLEKLKNHHVIRRCDPEDREELNDALIEAKQLASMTQLNAQIFQQLSGAYNNVLNNNLNENLTTLTIISIILAVFGVITGFFGMNIALPMMKTPHAWVYIVGLFIILWGVIKVILDYIVNRH
jgi:corA family transporter